MACNTSPVDRVIRVVVGLALLAAVPFTLWGLVGAVPLLTALIGYCPAYSLLGINTNKLRQPGR